MLAPPDERVKGMCVIVRSKRQQLCREVPNERRARPTFHAGSVSGCRVHSDFDLDAGLRDREFASKRGDQFRSRPERLFLRPKRVSSGFRLVGQPDLHRIAVPLPR
jgi:hypothetical protein